MEASNSETFADQPAQGSATDASGATSPTGAAESTPAPDVPSPTESAAPTQDPATNVPPPDAAVGGAQGPLPPADVAPPADGSASPPSAGPPASDVPAEPTFEEQQAAAAAAQSPAEQQVVPEQRPQAFVSPDPSAQSATAQRLAEEGSGQGAPAATEEDIARAQSEEAKTAAAEAGRRPRYLPGQRVTITSGDNQGRMGYVLSVNYTDAVQQMIANSGTPEAMYAEVDDYIIRTRDGRTDTFPVTPDQIQPLEINEGWGRGFI